MTVPFHGSKERGDRLLESFAADSIGGFPKNSQRRYGGVVIQPCPRRLLESFNLGSPQRPDRVLAVKARYFNELVKNLFLFASRSGLIPVRYRFDQLASGCQTQLPPVFVPRHVESER